MTKLSNFTKPLIKHSRYVGSKTEEILAQLDLVIVQPFERNLMES